MSTFMSTFGTGSLGPESPKQDQPQLLLNVKVAVHGSIFDSQPLAFDRSLQDIAVRSQGFR
jgi:hypothetical protein